LQRQLSLGLIDVVVITLECSPPLAYERREPVQLVVALVGNEMSPAAAAPWPAGLVNQDCHRSSLVYDSPAALDSGTK